METVKDMLMHYLIKLLLPTSPAYGNSIPFAKDNSISEILSTIEIGDVILTKTNNSIYQAGRKFLHTDYDHISVKINENEGSFSTI